MNEKERKFKAIAYARVSTLLGQDPEQQLIRIREFADNRQFDFVGEYVDKGISGVREKRPALDRLIADARMGKFQILIVTGIDRLGRSTKHLLNLLDELKHYGVSLNSLRENLDFSSATGQMALTMLGAVAQLERQLTSERIKSSLAAKRIVAERDGSGWRCGRPVKVTTNIEREVVELKAKGMSVRGIERALNKKISRGSVQRILKNYK